MKFQLIISSDPIHYIVKMPARNLGFDHLFQAQNVFRDLKISRFNPVVPDYAKKFYTIEVPFETAINLEVFSQDFTFDLNAPDSFLNQFTSICLSGHHSNFQEPASAGFRYKIDDALILKTWISKGCPSSIS